MPGCQPGQVTHVALSLAALRYFLSLGLSYSLLPTTDFISGFFFVLQQLSAPDDEARDISSRPFLIHYSVCLQKRKVSYLHRIEFRFRRGERAE